MKLCCLKNAITRVFDWKWRFRWKTVQQIVNDQNSAFSGKNVCKPRHFTGKVYFAASLFVGNLLADSHCPLGCGPVVD